MTLRRVNYNGRMQLREMSTDQWAAYRRAENIRHRKKTSKENQEVEKMIKEQARAPVERILVGDRGHWIERHDEPAGDGRQKYSIWSPGGELLSIMWEKDAAERAAESEIGSRK
jgi:hypothetical protein